VHLIGSRPGRANKVLSIRRRNSKTIIRNVFIDNRIVSLVIRYIKGLSKSIKGSIVIRFLPERVGRLIV
jgi:hypothetical protein